ncbi:MAG TPA: MipA/OmpV family protein, partial [Steroidobacteraceae bacterium]|nr:MipA/OmpV family protein [Steroidobacteraceae bacterium]
STMNRTLRSVLPLLATAAAVSPLPAAAQSACTAPSQDCVVVGDLSVSLSFGAGTRTNPVRGRSDIPLFVIPEVSYYGKRFFLESLEPGVTLYESDANTFNLIATPGYDRVFFSRSDLQNVVVSSFSGNVDGNPPPLVDQSFPVGRRHTTYLAGPEWLFRYRDLIGQVNALYEVTGRHQGYEMRAAVSAPLIQTNQSLVVSGGWTWKSAATVDYYYGVNNLYEPDAAFNPFIKLSYVLPLSERWTLTAFVHYEYLDDTIVDSPIVSDREVITAFAGFKFKVL